MKNYFKSGYQKKNGKFKFNYLCFLLFFAFSFIPTIINAQGCYCDVPNAKIIGSAVSVETISEAVSLGLLQQNTSPFSPPQSICIKGDLSVDIGYSFFDAEINMGADAKITVESNRSFSIFDGSEIYGCTELWNSILVKSFATFRLRGSSIKDGEVAVDAKPVSNIDISGNNFTDNHIGFRASSKNPFGVSFVNQIGTFQSNNFSTSFGSTLLPPRAGELAFAGVFIENIGGFTIGASGSTGGGGFFSRIDNGIIANNSSMTVNGASFSPLLGNNLTFGQNINNIGNGLLATNSSAIVIGCQFFNTFQGIFGTNTNLTAINNIFPDQNAIGIRMENLTGKQVRIESNTFDTYLIGVNIFMANNTSVTINGNTIRMIEESNFDMNDADAAISVINSNFNDDNPCSIFANEIELFDSPIGVLLFNSNNAEVAGNPNISFESIADLEDWPLVTGGIVIGGGGGGHDIVDNIIVGLGAGVQVPFKLA